MLVSQLPIRFIDTYTDAAEFASHFPDLYKTTLQEVFDYVGLQLMFMLKSDIRCERNALFRVGKDGIIHRISDNVC